MNGQIVNSRQNPYCKIPDPPDRVLDDFAVTIDNTPSSDGLPRGLDDSMLSRSHDSKNFKFQAHTPSFKGYSDFDAYMPWRGMRLCNLSPEGEVLAYEGDADFNYSPETGDVMVEIPKFYYMVDVDDTLHTVTLHISPNEHEGWYVSSRHQKFGDRTKDFDKIYVSAYYPDITGRSAAGLQPALNSTFYNVLLLRGTKSGYYQMDYLTLMTLELLKLVETCAFTFKPIRVSKNSLDDIDPSSLYNGFSIDYGFHSGVDSLDENNGHAVYRNFEIPGFTYNIGYLSPVTSLSGVRFFEGILYVSKDPSFAAAKKEHLNLADYKFRFPGDNTDISNDIRGSSIYYNAGYIHNPDAMYHDFSAIYIPAKYEISDHGCGIRFSNWVPGENINAYSKPLSLSMCGTLSLISADHWSTIDSVSSFNSSARLSSRVIYLPPEN